MAKREFPIDLRAKTCTKCWEEKSIKEFRLRRKGTEHRHNQCNNCFREEQRLRRAAKRDRRMNKFAQQVAAMQGRSSAGAVEAFVKQMMGRLGGEDAFTSACVESWKAARESGKHDVAFRWNRMFLHLCEIAQDSRERRPKPRVPPEVFQKEIERHLLGVIKQNPEVVIWAADELGCRITWHDLEE